MYTQPSVPAIRKLLHTHCGLDLQTCVSEWILTSRQSQYIINVGSSAVAGDRVNFFHYGNGGHGQSVSLRTDMVEVHVQQKQTNTRFPQKHDGYVRGSHF